MPVKPRTTRAPQPAEKKKSAPSPAPRAKPVTSREPRFPIVGIGASAEGLEENEELKFTKEEQQSLNEELTTVNAEMQSKVDDLSRTNDDMRRLTDEPTTPHRAALPLRDFPRL